MTVYTLLFMAAFAAAVCALAVRHAKASAPPPLRPDFLREAFARQSRGPTTGERVAVWMMRLGLGLPGTVLLVFADRAIGRVIGGALLGWVALQTLLVAWFRRSGRLEKAQQRALAASEAFWSQPDAEDRAREMRRHPFRAAQEGLANAAGGGITGVARVSPNAPHGRVTRHSTLLSKRHSERERPAVRTMRGNAGRSTARVRLAMLSTCNARSRLTATASSRIPVHPARSSN